MLRAVSEGIRLADALLKPSEVRHLSADCGLVLGINRLDA
jgi:hypothetical protein